MLDIENCIFKDNCKKYKDLKCPLNNKEENFCIKLFKINELQNNALLTDKQKQYIPLRLDADGSDREAFTRLKEIENDIDNYIQKGNNLYIYSAITGNGKSAWCLRLLNSYFNKIWYKTGDECRGLFINVSKFLLQLKDNITKKSDYISYIKDNVLNADVVIWDDIATKGFTQFEMENIFNLINNRIDEGKSNFYTSNILGQDLREAIGDRLYSRVVNASETITFVGADKRGKV